MNTVQYNHFVIYLSFILGIIIFLLLIEALNHRKALNSIPYRIHVNGTRGKSSVTRLIAAGLRAGGIRTSAKTTGTLPRFIYPDGSEENIYRPGLTNINEQIKIIKKASQLDSKAIVIECMALQPILQSVCERRLIQSTHGVLTNARPDHLEVMGPTENDVALALAGTVTIKGEYFTTENNHLKIFQMAANDRHSILNHIDQNQINQISDDEIKQFTYREFKENVALALSICQSLGVDRQTALTGMWHATPDPGAMTITPISFHNHTIIFANGFAVNDPTSTYILWERLLQEYHDYDDSTIIINCREDRIERSIQLGEAITTWETPSEVLLVGSGTQSFLKSYKRSNKLKHQDFPVYQLAAYSPDEILNHITRSSENKVHLVIGIGNIAGTGLQLVEYVQFLKEHTSC